MPHYCGVWVEFMFPTWPPLTPWEAELRLPLCEGKSWVPICPSLILPWQWGSIARYRLMGGNLAPHLVSAGCRRGVASVFLWCVVVGGQLLSKSFLSC